MKRTVKPGCRFRAVVPKLLAPQAGRVVQGGSASSLGAWSDMPYCSWIGPGVARAGWGSLASSLSPPAWVGALVPPATPALCTLRGSPLSQSAHSPMVLGRVPVHRVMSFGPRGGDSANCHDPHPKFPDPWGAWLVRSCGSTCHALSTPALGHMAKCSPLDRDLQSRFCALAFF